MAHASCRKSVHGHDHVTTPEDGDENKIYREALISMSEKIVHSKTSGDMMMQIVQNPFLLKINKKASKLVITSNESN